MLLLMLSEAGTAPQTGLVLETWVLGQYGLGVKIGLRRSTP